MSVSKGVGEGSDGRVAMNKSSFLQPKITDYVQDLSIDGTQNCRRHRLYRTISHTKSFIKAYLK